MARTPQEKAGLKKWNSRSKMSEQPANINDKEFKIHVTHIPTGEKVDFKGWVTGFQDNFQSQWTGTPVYGRMDDLYTFQKTSRRLSLAFDVIAADSVEAIENLEKLNRLTQFLYPVYSDSVAKNPASPARNSQVLTAAPLLKLKWNSLAKNAATGEELVGFLAGFIYQPVIDNGQFFAKGGAMAYQNHTIQLEFTVLHTHLTGWTKDGNTLTFGGSKELQRNYPHGPGPAQAPAENQADFESFRAGAIGQGISLRAAPGATNQFSLGSYASTIPTSWAPADLSKITGGD